MYKKLARHGNSSALVLEKPILELLNITDSTQLKVSTDGTSLIITPVITPVHQEVPDSKSEENLKPFKDLSSFYTNFMSHGQETHQLIKQYAENPTLEIQKQLFEVMQRQQGSFSKSPNFWQSRKEVMDAYAPSLDEKMQAMIKEFSDVDLKQFPERVQQLYREVEKAPTSPRSIEIMNTQEYIDAMKQIQPVLTAKFTKLFQENNSAHGHLQKEMLENFAKVRADAD